MQDLKILNSKEVKKILKILESQFGFKDKLEFVFLQSSKDRLYIVNRDIERIELEKLRVNALGLYFATIAKDGIRLSIEGSQIIGPKAKKNILELTDFQFEFWLKGIDMKIENDLEGFVLVKHGKDFVGCGKLKEGTLLNYVPKSRRLVVVNN
ncbi:hypothetical protein ACFLTH_04755 [Bacteroidota bacterium]